MNITRKQKAATTQNQMRGRTRAASLPTNKFIPVVLDEATYKGTQSSQDYLTGKWKCLTLDRKFNATVFESGQANLEVLYDAILPKNVNTFKVEDLCHVPLFVKLKTSQCKKYINIMDIKPFDNEHASLLQEYQKGLSTVEQLESRIKELTMTTEEQDFTEEMNSTKASKPRKRNRLTNRRNSTGFAEDVQENKGVVVKNSMEDKDLLDEDLDLELDEEDLTLEDEDLDLELDEEDSALEDEELKVGDEENNY